MKRIVIVAIAMVIGAFGFRTTGSQPSEAPVPSTTTVPTQTTSFGAHDVLQEELSDPTAFAG
jgi:hypothetical protein